MRRGLIALLFAGLLVLPAAAQVDPVAQPSGVAMDPATRDVEVSSERPTSFTVTVTHTGGLQGPLAQFGGERQFRISAVDVPDGLTVQVEPANLDLPPGESGEVRVRVSVPAGRGTFEGGFDVLAQLVPQGAQGVPEAGPIVDPDAQARTEVQVDQVETLARTGLETIGNWLYVILLALLTAVTIIGKLALDRRRAYVQLHCEQRQVVLSPGGRGAFRLLVENTGRNDDTIVFHLSEVDAGWAAWLPSPEAQVRADHVEELRLMIVAPKDARPGDRQEIQVTAAAGAQPNKPARLTLEAIVTEGEIPGRA